MRYYSTSTQRAKMKTRPGIGEDVDMEDQAPRMGI